MLGAQYLFNNPLTARPSHVIHGFWVHIYFDMAKAARILRGISHAEDKQRVHPAETTILEYYDHSCEGSKQTVYTMGSVVRRVEAPPLPVT